MTFQGYPYIIFFAKKRYQDLRAFGQTVST